MALRNPKLFGLNVLSFFADVENKNLALQNLNLPPIDLEVILGSSDAGANRSDWISFSRLHDPLHKTLDRFNRDSSNYNGILLDRAGADGVLFGNLKINGSLSGNAIRYRYVKGLGTNTREIGIADISTSRISAWSSSASPVLPTSPISYGARLGIKSTGKLKFGTSTITGPRLRTSIVPQEKEFPSEFPTHKIKLNIDGVDRELYAMKGIPVIFTGFFRNLDATIKVSLVSVDGNLISPSWKIVETGNPNRYSSFKDQGGATSTINYRSSISRERFIQFYYNPDKITSVEIQSANISSLPAVKFNAATFFNFSYNQLREFPTLTTNGVGVGVAENLTTLLLRRNPFHLSEFESERRLQNTSYNASLTFANGSKRTDTVLDKIPAGVQELYLEGTFPGSITQNIIADRFTVLTRLDFGRGGGQRFHPDSVDSSSPLPNVPNSVEVYNLQNNDFRTIGTSDTGNGRYNVNDLENLISLNLYGNYYLSGNNFQIAPTNTVITSINIGSTNLPFPANLSGSQSLERFDAVYARNLGKLVDLPNSKDYVFDNCSALGTIGLYAATGISGSRFPIFTNINLGSLDLRYTGVRGGAPDGNDSFVIPADTFKFTTNLSGLYIDSGNLLTAPIHPDALINITSLSYFWYRSYGRTSGILPSFAGNPNLSTVWMHHNAFTGSMPNFAANQSIYQIRLSNNQLTGQIPPIKNLSNLRYLFIQNNQFTSMGTPENLPRLEYIYVHNNQIQGEIPDLSGVPRLYYLIMYNNQLTGYKNGSFASLTRIRYIDLSTNSITQLSLEQIFDDLYTNWKSSNRGGVTVNVRGNGAPSESTLEIITILKSKGWNITHD